MWEFVREFLFRCAYRLLDFSHCYMTPRNDGCKSLLRGRKGEAGKAGPVSGGVREDYSGACEKIKI